MTNIADDKIRFTKAGAARSGIGGLMAKCQVLEIDTADLTATATTQTFDFASQLPANSQMIRLGYRVFEDFAGGGVTACTLDLGDGTNADRFLDAVNIFTGAANTYTDEDPTSLGDGVAAESLPLPLAAALTLRATITSTTADVDQLTAGRLKVYVWYYEGNEDPEED